MFDREVAEPELAALLRPLRHCAATGTRVAAARSASNM
jgi:hypothetical protein